MVVSNIEKYKSEIEGLILRGNMLENAIFKQNDRKDYEDQIRKQIKDKEKAEAFIKETPDFSEDYQSWYSESLALIRQILPDRVEDFKRHYEKPQNRKELTPGTYVISDALHGLIRKNSWDDEIICDARSAVTHIRQQVAIVRAVKGRFESSLYDIRQLVQADLFDDELAAARELLKRGFIRAAGAVAGVVLEHHLAQVCENHNISVKKNPTIADFNDKLKAADVIDTPRWRSIQLLGDLRNLCDHNKEREPTKEEGEDLILGVERLAKSLF